MGAVILAYSLIYPLLWTYSPKKIQKKKKKIPFTLSLASTLVVSEKTGRLDKDQSEPKRLAS